MAKKKTEIATVTEIRGIENAYGGLNVKKDGGKFYWSIENYNGFEWQEIPESLYKELIKFHNKDKV